MSACLILLCVTDFRRCAYNLFSAVSFIVKEEMSTVLPKIVPLLLLSVKSKEGISLQVGNLDETSVDQYWSKVFGEI